MTTSDGGGDQQKPRSGPRATYPAEQSAGSKRTWFVVLASVVVAAGLALAVLGFNQFGDPEVSGQATGYELLSSDRVAVQYTVNRANPGDAVVCIVRARAKDGSEVGRREVLIPAGTDIQVGARAELTTSTPPVIGEVFGCGLSIPPYLDSKS